jgi:hypothetical protein
MAIWSVGNQLFSTGLGSAWYKSRTVASMMAREMILGISRLIFVPIMIYILYYFSPAIFIYFMLGLSALMLLYALNWMRAIKLKGPVMPIENIVSPR